MERIYIEDLSGNLVNDVEAQRVLDYATELTYSSQWPKGYSACSFTLRRADILDGFTVDVFYNVIVQDGQRIVWQGEIIAVKQVISGGGEYLQIEAVGKYAALNRVHIRKRWRDIDSLKTLFVTQGREIVSAQNDFLIQNAGRYLSVAMARDSQNRDWTEYASFTYDAGAPLKAISFSYYIRSGENISVRLRNVDNSVTEPVGSLVETYFTLIDSSSGGKTASVSYSFLGGDTNTYELWIGPRASPADNYDQNDLFILYTVHSTTKYDSSHPNYGSELFYPTEILTDALLISGLLGGELSADLDGIESQGTTVAAYAMEEYAPVSSAIEDIAKLSDSSYRTWGLSVWDRAGTSDDLPKIEYSYWDNSDYEYVIDLRGADLIQFNNSRETGRISNYIRVQYVNPDGYITIRTPDDNASLKDATSITTYGQRDYLIKIGKATDAAADRIGIAFLTKNKEPQYVGNITVGATVKTKAGGWMPSNSVRAGQRFYVPELGQIFVIGATSYDAETRKLTVTPSAAPDTVPLMLAELERDAAASEPGYAKFG